MNKFRELTICQELALQDYKKECLESSTFKRKFPTFWDYYPSWCWGEYIPCDIPDSIRKQYNLTGK